MIFLSKYIVTIIIFYIFQYNKRFIILKKKTTKNKDIQTFFFVSTFFFHFLCKYILKQIKITKLVINFAFHFKRNIINLFDQLKLNNETRKVKKGTCNSF